MARFIRFSTLKIHQDSGLEEGLFQRAYRLLHGQDISATDRDELDAILCWFDKNLKEPERFNRSSSKGFGRRKTKGISWFKPDAQVHIARMRSLAAILDSNGHLTQQVSAVKIGYIVYEDEHQVVAEPFRD